MNVKKAILTFALASVLIIGCKEKSNETNLKERAEMAAPKVEKKIAANTIQTASFSVAGMSCAIGCAKIIQEDIAKLEGVQKATVDFDTKKATVTFDKTLQTPSTIAKVVEGAADGKTYKVFNIKS